MKKILHTLLVAAVMVFTMGLSAFPQTIQAATWNGIDVATIQTRLNNWATYNQSIAENYGYLVVDGSYGTKTMEMVKVYQIVHELTPDGNVGPKTWSYLQNEYYAYVWETQNAVNQILSQKQYGNKYASYILVKDGSYGPATITSVKLVQQLLGLTADGIAGPQTWKVFSDRFFL